MREVIADQWLISDWSECFAGASLAEVCAQWPVIGRVMVTTGTLLSTTNTVQFFFLNRTIKQNT